MLSYVLPLVLGASVTLVTDDCPAPLQQAVRDELRADGFDVGVDDVAKISLVCTADQVEVRMADKVTNKDERRTLLQLTGERAERKVAIQVVELLHASLSETRFQRTRRVVLAQGDALPEEFPPSEPPPPPLKAMTEVRAGILGDVGPFGVEPVVALASSLPVRRWEFGGVVSLTVRGSKLASDSGTVVTGLGLLQMSVALPVNFGAWVVRPEIRLGVLGAWSDGFNGGFHIEATVAGTGAISVWRELPNRLALGLLFELSAAPIPIRIELPGLSSSLGVRLTSLELGLRF